MVVNLEHVDPPVAVVEQGGPEWELEIYEEIATQELLEEAVPQHHGDRPGVFVTR